jgi:hypothetical protein
VKRIALLLLALLGVAAARATDIAITQALDAGMDTAENTTNRTKIYTANITAGAVLVACFSSRDNNPDNFSVTDNKANTWVKIGSTYEAGSGRGVRCDYAVANPASIGAAPTVTFNKNATSCGVGGSIYEFANVAAAVLDGTPVTANGVSSGPAQVVLGSTTFTNDLIFAALGTEQSAFTTATHLTNYVDSIANTNTTVSLQHKTETRNVTSAAAYTPGWTLNVSSHWAVVGFALKGNTTAPTITSTSPAPSVSNGATLTINGVNLKASGNSTVTFGGTSQTVTTQSATAPQITVARGTNKYGSCAGSTQTGLNLILTDSASAISNTFATTGIIPQSGWSCVDLAGTLASSGNRITAVSDLAAGDELAYDNKSSLVTVNPDGSFVADPSVTSFNVEAWTTGSGWGSSALETINGVASSGQQMLLMFPR